jgi:type I restriction enzyme S subunit
MIDGLKPYAEYKDSGLSWLGKIPAHWNEQPGFAVFREKQEKNIGLREKRVLSLSYGRIVIKPDDKLHGLVPDSFETYQIVNPGDIIIRSTDLQNDWNSLRVGLVRDRGIITSAYLCFHNLGSFTPEFAFFLLHSYDLQKFFYGFGSGLRQNLDFGDFKRLPFPIPPRDEQDAIVRFLSDANGRIERAIQAKKKLIALLNEQKQAIIHHAFTQGRESQWASFPVRAVLQPVKRVGFAGKTLLSLFRDHGVILKDSRENKNADVRDLALCQLVEPGDVVMNKMKAWQGSIAVSTLEGIVSPDYMVLKMINDWLRPGFLHYLLRSPMMVAEYRRRAYGVRPGQWRLMYPDFCRLTLCAPQIQEQEKVISYIRTETQSRDSALSRAEREIELLREYRTGLVADVVTGKLDVRDAAAKLPAKRQEHESSVVDESNPVEVEEVAE